MPRPIPPELADDTPYGLASADFPVTFYDQPELMFANLLRGDVDGMTRAMLSPDTLSPSQMRDVRALLTRGKKTSPVMKTILEVATNPLVIVGLIAALRYPMGSTKTLLAIREGMLPKAAAMGKMASGLHGALMNARTIPGLYDGLWGYARGIEKFISTKGKAAQKIFAEAVATQSLSSADRVIVGARLDGLHTTSHPMYQMLKDTPEYIKFFGSSDVPIAANMQAKMTPRQISLADKLKTLYKDLWDAVYGNAAFKESGGKAAAKRGLTIGGEQSNYFPHNSEYNPYFKKAISEPTGVMHRKHMAAQLEQRVGKQAIEREGAFISREHMLIKEQAGIVPRGFVQKVYDPYIARLSDEATGVAGRIWDDIARVGLSQTEQRVEFINRMTDYYTKGPGKNTNLVARLGDSARARDTLDAMGASLQEAAGLGDDALWGELGKIGKAMGSPATYGVDVVDATERYVNAAAGDYVWHTEGYGAKINSAMEAPGAFAGAPHLKTYFVDGVIPHLRGYNTFKQMQRTISDAVRKMKIANWIDKHPMVRQTLGNNHTDALLGWINKPGSLSSASVGGQVANWFHLSTLGLNLSASSTNAMQTFLTTINNVGAGGIWRGLNGFGTEKGLISRASDFAGMLASGVKNEDAFRRAFPEFVEEMGEWSKTTERLLSGDVAQAGYDKLFKAKGVWDKIKGAMMAPFSTTEAGNQLLSFYAGRNQHLFRNATRIGDAALSAEASKVGGSLAQLTQFAGGPLGIPRMIMDMNPMWRQFVHFPMRYLSWLHGSLRMGVDPSKLDWGTIGRALTGSTAGYIAARNLMGVDLSKGLMIGALPLPGYEKAPFYPFPFVPPAVGLIGEAGKALMTGEGESLKSALPMLVPGGIALRRAYRSWSPRYADYQHRNSDGTIPLYNEDKSLIGSLTPMELTLRAVGIKPMNVSAEAGASQWLLKQRDRLREYRRQYTEAVVNNEPVEAEKINAAFQKAYPELGPIVLKKSDVRAIEDRREMSRIQRITKGMSRAYQPIFENVLAEAGLRQMTQHLESPELSGLQQQFFPPQ